MRASLFMALLCALPLSAFADDMAGMNHGHEDLSPFHYARLEADIGDDRGDAATRWDLDAWAGDDTNKVWLKSEGDIKGGDTVRSEFWGLYSRNVADFWDVQAGIRHDTDPHSNSYLVLGIQGLAQYYFETEAHLFISDQGDFSARITERNDLLITQRLIAQPYAEINFYANSDTERYIGSGIGGTVGLQTRYEFTRQFAPYLDLRYEDRFGEAATQAERAGDDGRSFIASIGLRLMF